MVCQIFFMAGAEKMTIFISKSLKYDKISANLLLFADDYSCIIYFLIDFLHVLVNILCCSIKRRKLGKI